MRLKRLYDHDAPAARWLVRRLTCSECKGTGAVLAAGRTPATCPTCSGAKQVEDRVPPVRGVEVQRAPMVQRFSARLVDGATGEGWLSLVDGQIVLKSDPPTVYRIVRAPGYYCCHCDEKLGGEHVARDHVAAVHTEQDSPDKMRPAGYLRAMYFEGVLEGEPIHA